MRNTDRLGGVIITDGYKLDGSEKDVEKIIAEAAMPGGRAYMGTKHVVFVVRRAVP
jgi:hypothetical protein